MPADAGAPGMSRETLNPEPGMSPGSGFPLRETTMLEEDPVACHPGCTCGDCWQRMPPELAPVAWPEAPPQWPLTAMVRCSDIEEMRARVRRWIASGYLARAFLESCHLEEPSEGSSEALDRIWVPGSRLSCHLEEPSEDQG
jgi:hypothetical protein